MGLNGLGEAFFWFVLGVPLVELVGYLWHRFVEHGGILGESLRYRHWIHHECEYPADDLRPEERYQDTKDSSWFVLALLTLGALGLLLLLGVLSLAEMVLLFAGGVFYGHFVVRVLHQLYHLPRHWLHGFRWFQRLIFLHDLHHWRRCNYGILFFWLDRLFGTFRETRPSTAVNLFPGVAKGKPDLPGSH